MKVLIETLKQTWLVIILTIVCVSCLSMLIYYCFTISSILLMIVLITLNCIVVLTTFIIVSDVHYQLKRQGF